MNCWEIFLLTIAVVLLVFTQQSNCLIASFGIELNIDGNTLGNGCENDENPFENTNNSPGSDATDPKLVLKNGFTDFNITVAAAENIAMRGFTLANKLALTQPTSAIQELQAAIDDALNTFFGSGIFVLFSLGRASVLTNDTVRPILIEATVQLQSVALEMINEIRIATALATQELLGQGDAKKQALVASQQIIQAAFASMYNVTSFSLQQATKAVTDAQRIPMQRQIKYQNFHAAAKNSDATAAISDINKAARDSINRGASTFKVNRLREMVVNAVGDFADVASQARDNFADTQKAADTDPSLAKNKYLKNFKDVSEKVQEIVARTCLGFVPGIKSDRSSLEELEKAFVEVEQGNDAVAVGNRVAKHLIILALEQKYSVPSLLFNAAVQSFKYGEIAFYRRIVKGVSKVFDIL